MNLQETRKFLVDSFNLDFDPIDKNYWRHLNDYRRVRNIIAHNAGQVNEKSPNSTSKNKTALKNLGSRLGFENIYESESGDLFISSPEILIDFCNLVEGFMEELLIEIDRKVHKAK